MPVPRNVKLLTAIAAGAVATATCAGVVLLFEGGAAAEALPRLARPAPVGAVLAVSHTNVGPAPGRDPAAGGDAGAFLLEMIRMKHEGAWAESWDLLYPPHRAVVSRAVYVKCEGREPMPGTLESVTVVRVADERFLPAGAEVPVASKAVTIRFSVSHPDVEKPYVFTSTFHAAPNDGAWWWFLTEDRYAAFSRGACPA